MTHFRLIILLTLLTFTSLSLYAQLPSTKVYCFDLRQSSDTSFTLSNPTFLTSFNENGYNNQPYWFNDKLLYLSVQMPDQSQPDIWAFDIDKKTRVQITDTHSGEFSPQQMPDYYHFSAVRQEYNGVDTVLRLWQFPSDRLTNGKPVFKDITGIAYYQWLNSYQVVAYMVSEPNGLYRLDTRTEESTLLALDAGRSFTRLPNGNLAYLDLSDRVIKERNLYRMRDKPRPIAPALPNSEDFIILGNGTIIMGSGSSLYAYNPYQNAEWKEIVDLQYYGIRYISRLALSREGRLALVSD